MLTPPLDDDAAQQLVDELDQLSLPARDRNALAHVIGWAAMERPETTTVVPTRGPLLTLTRTRGRIPDRLHDTVTRAYRRWVRQLAEVHGELDTRVWCTLLEHDADDPLTRLHRSRFGRFGPLGEGRELDLEHLPRGADERTSVHVWAGDGQAPDRTVTLTAVYGFHVPTAGVLTVEQVPSNVADAWQRADHGRVATAALGPDAVTLAAALAADGRRFSDACADAARLTR